MKLILASKSDPAAMNIAARLLELYDFEETTKGQHVFSDYLTLITIAEESTKLDVLPYPADEVIVASRHASEAGKPSLTTHVPGDIGKGELAMASPRTIKSALLALRKKSESLKIAYEVSLEATHHGPTRLEVPVTFVEIGSRPQQWVDEKAGEVVADAIMEAASSKTKCTNAIGLGGPHYAPRHTDAALHTDVGIGHILPKYAKFDERMVELAVGRTQGGVELLVLDWKGLDAEQRIICQNAAKALGIGVERSKEIPRR